MSTNIHKIASLMSSYELVMEGEVSSAKSKIISALNKIASRIAKKAETLGLKCDTYYIEDVAETIKATKVEIQFGNNAAFRLSQIVEITVYDVDDIVIELPIAFDKRYKVPTYYSHKGANALTNTLKLLTKLRNLVGVQHGRRR